MTSPMSAWRAPSQGQLSGEGYRYKQLPEIIAATEV